MDMKEHIKCKCFDVADAKIEYERARAAFLESSHLFEEGKTTPDIVAYDAEKMKELYLRYDILRFEVHQFVWELGDEYKAIWNEMIGSSK